MGWRFLHLISFVHSPFIEKKVLWCFQRVEFCFYLAVLGIVIVIQIKQAVIHKSEANFTEHYKNCVQIKAFVVVIVIHIQIRRHKASPSCRVEICRDRHDRRSCKIFASCVYFPGKQHNFSHNLRRTTRFTHTKCDFSLKLLKFYTLSWILTRKLLK